MILTKIKSELQRLKRTEMGALLLVILVILSERLYFTFTTPLHVDEAYTFLHFTSKGIWQSMSYYPEPNNHILFSVITAIFYHLYPDMSFALRFPAFLISTLVTIFLFFSVKRYAGFWVALLGIGLFCFSNVALYYSFVARGYFLLTGLSFLIAFSALEYVRTGRRTALVYFCLAAILGTYTVPVFVYPLISTGVFAAIVVLVNRRFDLLIQLLAGGLIAGCIILLLYLPVFLVSGPNAVFANEFVVSLSAEEFRKGFFWFIKYVGNDLVGKEYYGFLFGILVTIGYLFYLVNQLLKKGREAFADLSFLFILLLGCLQIVPLFVVSVQRVFPYSRVWLYLSAFQFVGFAWLVVKSLEYFKLRKAIWPAIILLLTGYGAHQLRVYYRFEKGAIQVNDSIKRVVQFMVQAKPQRSYMQHYYYEVFTRIAFNELGEKIAIDVKRNFNPTADYEFFLLDVKVPPPAHFKPEAASEIYRDNFVVIYKKR